MVLCFRRPPVGRAEPAEPVAVAVRLPSGCNRAQPSVTARCDAERPSSRSGPASQPDSPWAQLQACPVVGKLRRGIPQERRLGNGGAFRNPRGPLISSLRVPSWAKLPTGQSHAQAPCGSLRDGLQPTLRRESPAEPGHVPEVASRTPNRVEPLCPWPGISPAAGIPL